MKLSLSTRVARGAEATQGCRVDGPAGARAARAPRTTGELFLYVNDAVWVFGDVSIFYRNNSGTGSAKGKPARDRR